MNKPNEFLVPETKADWDSLCEGLNLPPPDSGFVHRRATREMRPELLQALVEASEEQHKP